MSEPITLTERERAVFAAFAAELERSKSLYRVCVGDTIREWLAGMPITESASPPRVPGASAQSYEVGVESGPGQPMDICERLDMSASIKDDGDELIQLLVDDAREAAAEIRRLRAEVEPLRDPAMLHANLLRGFPATLTQEQRLHLVGSAKIDEIRADGFRAGIEAAARWHDEKADFCARNFGDEDIGAKMIREDHREYAGAIRALAAAPAPDPLLAGLAHVREHLRTDGHAVRLIAWLDAEIAKRGGTEGS